MQNSGSPEQNQQTTVPERHDYNVSIITTVLTCSIFMVIVAVYIFPGYEYNTYADLVRKIADLENQLETTRKEFKDFSEEHWNVVNGPVSSVEGLSYNYFDEMAQSYCAASHKFFTFTIRRDCAGVAPTCQDICENAKKEILARTGNSRKDVACYDALFIRKGHPKLRLNPSPAQPDSGLVSMETYGYGSQGCSWEPNHCGPNYCCCKAY